MPSGRNCGGRAVELPDNDDVKDATLTVLYHLLELRTVVCLGRDSTVNIVLDDGDAVLSCALPNLTFDGFLVLVVAGIAGVDHSSHGKHLHLYIIERWSVLSKYCFV